VWDARRARWIMATVLVLPVAHPEHPEGPLSLVVCRSQGRSPWYLLTAEPLTTDEQAWRVVYAYVRRWQIELSWKYEKSELAFQSPRVYEGEAREKLLLLATLAYAFLLSLLNEGMELLRFWLLLDFSLLRTPHAKEAERAFPVSVAPSTPGRRCRH
jgi:hypothetical protein